MPYIGLLDCKTREITAPDYHRKDMSSVQFKMSPPINEDCQLTFVLNSPISFTAGSNWGWIGMVALFHEPTGREPFSRTPITAAKIALRARQGDTLMIARGSLVFPVSKLPWDDPPEEPKPSPEPFWGRLARLMRHE